MISTEPVDFNEMSKKLSKTDSPEDIKNLREACAQLIEKQGLSGFFNEKRKHYPAGIVLDYDVEEVKGN